MNLTERYISSDEGFRGSLSEPWTCSNPNCGQRWSERPEVWQCSTGHNVSLCEECKRTCGSCGHVYCVACLSRVNWGEGDVWNCHACILDAGENLDRCTGCQRLRCDLEEREDVDAEYGYREISRLCVDCRTPIVPDAIVWPEDGTVRF